MTLTKKWLQQTIAAMESQRDEAPFGISDDHDMTLEAFKLALAGMEAEPVPGLFIKCTNIEPRPGEVTITQATPMPNGEYHDSCFQLYTAPQPLTTSERAELENYRNAQQVVPSITKHFDDIALETAREIMCDVNRRHELLGGEVQLLSRIQCRIDDALRAAMQSGAVIEGGWLAVSECRRQW